MKSTSLFSTITISWQTYGINPLLIRHSCSEFLMCASLNVACIEACSEKPHALYHGLGTFGEIKDIWEHFGSIGNIVGTLN